MIVETDQKKKTTHPQSIASPPLEHGEERMRGQKAIHVELIQPHLNIHDLVRGLHSLKEAGKNARGNEQGIGEEWLENGREELTGGGGERGSKRSGKTAGGEDG
jgi:hypothetical protein